MFKSVVFLALMVFPCAVGMKPLPKLPIVKRLVQTYMQKKFLVPHKKDNRFAPHNNHDERLLWHTVPSFLKTRLARLTLPSHDPHAWISRETPQERSQELIVTWIGHATFLIQVDGINLITDPVFGNISPVFRRLLPAGIPVTQLPPIDYTLISHNHPDHMDVASLLALKKRNPQMRVLVPHGDKAWFDWRNFEHAHEFVWWDEHACHEKKDVSCIFLPAVHWSRRGFFDTNRSLWGSWLIRAKNATVYFAGDTAYDDHFKEIAHAHPHIDVALMPIGPCEPDEWMRRSHISAEQAVQAAHDLQAHHTVPMHWGTFPFGNDSFEEPIERVTKAWRERDMGAKKLHLVKAGQRLLVPMKPRG